MPLVVEEGTGLSNAESYFAIAAADTYHTTRGNAAWATKTTAEKEQAARRGTQYLDNAYGRRWPGWRVLQRDQMLDWPRTNAYDRESNPILPDEVPREVIQAAIEAAFREAVTPNSLTPDVTVGRVVKRRTVGPITTEYEGRGDPIASARPTVTLIEEILAPLLAPKQQYTAQMARA